MLGRQITPSASKKIIINGKHVNQRVIHDPRKLNQAPQRTLPPPAVVPVSFLAGSNPVKVISAPGRSYDSQPPWGGAGGIARGLDPRTQWIWSNGPYDPVANAPAPDGPILFQTQVTNSSSLNQTALVKMLVDDFASVYGFDDKGQMIQLSPPNPQNQLVTAKGTFTPSFNGWSAINSFPIILKPGSNLIVVGGFNGGTNAYQNPAGLCVNITTADGVVLAVSDASWQYTTNIPTPPAPKPTLPQQSIGRPAHLKTSSVKKLPIQHVKKQLLSQAQIAPKLAQAQAQAQVQTQAELKSAQSIPDPVVRAQTVQVVQQQAKARVATQHKLQQAARILDPVKRTQALQSIQAQAKVQEAQHHKAQVQLQAAAKIADPIAKAQAIQTVLNTPKPQVIAPKVSATALPSPKVSATVSPSLGSKKNKNIFNDALQAQKRAAQQQQIAIQIQQKALDTTKQKLSTKPKNSNEYKQLSEQIKNLSAQLKTMIEKSSILPAHSQPNVAPVPPSVASATSKPTSQKKWQPNPQKMSPRSQRVILDIGVNVGNQRKFSENVHPSQFERPNVPQIHRNQPIGSGNNAEFAQVGRLTGHVQKLKNELDSLSAQLISQKEHFENFNAPIEAKSALIAGYHSLKAQFQNKYQQLISAIPV
jgi:hypothetical protein